MFVVLVYMWNCASKNGPGKTATAHGESGSKQADTGTGLLAGGGVWKRQLSEMTVDMCVRQTNVLTFLMRKVPFNSSSFSAVSTFLLFVSRTHACTLLRYYGIIYWVALRYI